MLQRDKPRCAVCERAAVARGLCNTHYVEQRRRQSGVLPPAEAGAVIRRRNAALKRRARIAKEVRAQFARSRRHPRGGGPAPVKGKYAKPYRFQFEMTPMGRKRRVVQEEGELKRAALDGPCRDCGCPTAYRVCLMCHPEQGGVF